MKKEVSINGRIVFPLEEGARAVISTGGGLTYTSLVVEIIEERPDYAFRIVRGRMKNGIGVSETESGNRHSILV